MPRQKADNPILALHCPLDQKQPRAANGVAVAAEDGRPDCGRGLALMDSDGQDERIDYFEETALRLLRLCLNLGN